MMERQMKVKRKKEKRRERHKKRKELYRSPKRVIDRTFETHIVKGKEREGK